MPQDARDVANAIKELRSLARCDVTRSCPAGAELVSTMPAAPYAFPERVKFRFFIGDRQ